jgi:hypothetical protein
MPRNKKKDLPPKDGYLAHLPWFQELRAEYGNKFSNKNVEKRRLQEQESKKSKKKPVKNPIPQKKTPKQKRRDRQERKKKRREERQRALPPVPGVCSEPINYLLGLSYPKYLRSWHWRLKRIEVFQHRGRLCEDCGSDQNLKIHHKTYVRRGCEKISDLRVLCEDCHNLTHGYVKYYIAETLDEIDNHVYAIRQEIAESRKVI